MNNQFNPMNKIIQMCMQMTRPDISYDQAIEIYHQAFNQATNDFELFLLAYFKAQVESDQLIKIDLLNQAIEYGLKADDECINSALITIYHQLAELYEKQSDKTKKEECLSLINYYNNLGQTKGPFFHGTKAKLKIGDQLVPGFNSNYQDELVMNHIYFTTNINGAILAASLSKQEGENHVYLIEPSGEFENDPNVTDKKFPGNLTGSFRSTFPLKIIDEIKDLSQINERLVDSYQNKVNNLKGQIIN